jgi:hypothetical protein
MIEGPAGPPPSREPRRISAARLLEGARESLARARRLVLPGQTNRESTDALLWRLRIAERLFWVVIAGLGCYLVVDLVLVQRRPPALAWLSNPQAVPEPSGTAVSPAEDHLQPLASYRESIIARNPFALAARRTIEAPGQQASQTRLQELVSTLSVVGISRGAVPEALIEDTVAKRTHFVKVGDTVNGVTVASIDEGGVTLSYEGETAVLK